MEILIDSVYKKFTHHWVIKNISAHFTSGKMYGISGPNGSGKTTFMQILAGLIPPSKGKIQHIQNLTCIPEIDWYKNLSYAAPYAEVFNYLRLHELVAYHSKMKPFYPSITVSDFIDICYLDRYQQQFIHTFSSGMKQRLKLALAILTQSEILFLDEPVSNLDDKAKEWYFDLIAKYKQNRIIVIASNEETDFTFIDEKITLHLN